MSVQASTVHNDYTLDMLMVSVTQGIDICANNRYIVLPVGSTLKTATIKNCCHVKNTEMCTQKTHDLELIHISNREFSRNHQQLQTIGIEKH